MSYVSPNFKTKKAIKEALAEGRRVSVYNPGVGGPVPDGNVSLEGPHFPEPHKWYATGVVKDGLLISVK